jgi:hypothetical protein
LTAGIATVAGGTALSGVIVDNADKIDNWFKNDFVNFWG